MSLSCPNYAALVVNSFDLLMVAFVTFIADSIDSFELRYYEQLLQLFDNVEFTYIVDT